MPGASSVYLPSGPGSGTFLGPFGGATAATAATKRGREYFILRRTTELFRKTRQTDSLVLMGQMHGIYTWVAT